MWKVEAGKLDCWGNVNHWRVYAKDDYWNATIVTTSRADADALADDRNNNVIPFTR